MLYMQQDMHLAKGCKNRAKRIIHDEEWMLNPILMSLITLLIKFYK